jgi:transposase
MHLKVHRRFKDGKEHRYWSIVESRRCLGHRVTQRHVLYLGEINDSQKEAWLKCIDAFDPENKTQVRLALFPSDRAVPEHAADFGVQVRLAEFTLRRPRQWGACWLFLELWRELKLDEFWRERLPASREGTDWYHVLVTLAAYRLIDPGSEWRLHRQWFERSALADLLGEDFSLAAKDNLYRVQDKLLAHKEALFGFLKERWQSLFGITFDVLLYDLTSTYFEIDAPENPDDKRRHGYSRDKRPDCAQVVIALVVTPEGFPLAYEVLPGNTADKTTLPLFLKKIESQYGQARRVWVMDRGIPTEEVLQAMRASDRPVHYLVGTPRGRLSQLEKELLDLPWQEARPGVEVKLLAQQGERYVLAKSHARVNKERAMRRRQLKKLWARLKELRDMKNLKRDGLLMKPGAARAQSPAAWRLVAIRAPQEGEDINEQTFAFRWRKDKLRTVRRREGRYLLRTNLNEEDPARLWQHYIQLTQVEEAFKNLKGDLAIRPIYHQLESRIEAHIFVSFLAYCAHVSLREKLRRRAPGLTPRSVLEKFGAMQMLDAHFPTTDGRELIFRRYTQPEAEQKILLDQLNLSLPEQAPPRITSGRQLQM